MISHRTCPNCNSGLRAATRVRGVYMCSRCSAVYGTCWEREAVSFVDLGTLKAQANGAEVRYFDFIINDGQPRRVHGWYDPSDRKVVQYG